MLRVVQDHAETLKRASKEEKLSKVLYANRLNDLDGYNLHFLFEKAIQNSYSSQSLLFIVVKTVQAVPLCCMQISVR